MVGERTPLSLVSGPPWLTPEPVAGLEVVSRLLPIHQSNNQVLDPSAAAAPPQYGRRLFVSLLCSSSQKFVGTGSCREEIPEAFDSCGIPTHLARSTTSGWASTLFRKAIFIFHLFV